MLRFVVFVIVTIITQCQCQYASQNPTESIIQSLKNYGFTGSILPYGNYAYERYRKVKNGACNVLYPLIIIRPANERDVAVGIKVARAVDVDISVRSGGHGYTCNNIKNGSLHFDLRKLNRVELVKDKYGKVGHGCGIKFHKKRALLHFEILPQKVAKINAA